MPEAKTAKKGADIQKDLRSTLLKLKRFKDKKSAINTQLSGLNEQIETLSNKAFDIMQGLGIQNMKLNNTTFFMTSKPYFSIKDKQKAMAWIKKNHPEMLTVNAQSLTSFLRSTYLEKAKKPPAFFNKYDKNSVGVRNSK